MNRLKVFLYRFLPKKFTKLNGDFKTKVIYINGAKVLLLIPKERNNPEVTFIKDWVDNPIPKITLRGDVLASTYEAHILDNYLRFSYDLFCTIKERGIPTKTIKSYKDYIKIFKIEVPGFKIYDDGQRGETKQTK